MTDEGIDRRQALTMALAATGTAVATPVVAQSLSAGGLHGIDRRRPDVVVIGAGAFGGWTALSLREHGLSVTLVDAYGAGNPHASSGGESRNIQFAYGDRAIYTRWARRAWDAWQRREQEFGRRLLFPSGSLRFRPKPVLDTDAAVFDRLGRAYEVLPGAEIRRRWPQIHSEDDEFAFYERNSGIVKARDSLIAVSEMFGRKGGTVQLGYAVPGSSKSGRLETVIVNGEPLSAGAFVFACGPWFPKVLPSLLGDRIKVPRRELFFIGAARGDMRYRWENAPYLSDATVYTSSDIGGGYKIAPTLRNVPMDPDDGDRLPTPFLLDQVSAYLARRLPGLVGRPVIQSHVCQLERTDNDHYIIDRHPDFANAWLAGGGSGHAFKMGPVLGEYVADRVLGHADDPETRAFFPLASHRPVPEGQGW